MFKLKKKVTSWMNDAVMSRNQTNCCTLELGNPSQSDITFHEIPSCKPWKPIKTYHHLHPVWFFNLMISNWFLCFKHTIPCVFLKIPPLFLQFFFFFGFPKDPPQQPFSHPTALRRILWGWEELEAKSKELEVERRHLLNSFLGPMRCLRLYVEKFTRMIAGWKFLPP